LHERSAWGLTLAAFAVLYLLSRPVHGQFNPHPLATWLSGYAAVIGAILALIPRSRVTRWWQRWELWPQLAIFLFLFTIRMSTDPRCRVVLDPHQHGCHSFVIAIVLGIVGLMLAWR
jgi:hypothetical protein